METQEKLMIAVDFQSPMDDAMTSEGILPEVVIKHTERPKPGAGEVLIKVAAAGINNLDLMQREGKYPVPQGVTSIPGVEVSGIIVELGIDVEDWEINTPVCALLAGGGYAQYVSVDVRQVLPVPKGVSMIEAAALPEVAATCWANLFMQGQGSAGEWVLIHGGTGGVGSFALQLCAAMGLKPLATVGSEEKKRLACAAGAIEAINYSKDNFLERVTDITSGHGVDLILDVVGGRYLRDNIQALALHGRLVTIGLTGGANGQLDLSLLMAKQAWVTGSTLRSRSAAKKGEIIEGLVEHVWPLIAEGSISAGIAASFKLEETEKALDFFSSPGRVGKVVLTMHD